MGTIASRVVAGPEHGLWRTKFADERA